MGFWAEQKGDSSNCHIIGRGKDRTSGFNPITKTWRNSSSVLRTRYTPGGSRGLKSKLLANLVEVQAVASEI